MPTMGTTTFRKTIAPCSLRAADAVAYPHQYPQASRGARSSGCIVQAMVYIGSGARVPPLACTAQPLALSLIGAGVGMTLQSCAVTPHNQASRRCQQGHCTRHGQRCHAGPKNPNRCRPSATYPSTIRTPIHPPEGRHCQRLHCAGDPRHPGVTPARMTAHGIRRLPDDV